MPEPVRLNLLLKEFMLLVPGSSCPVFLDWTPPPKILIMEGLIHR